MVILISIGYACQKEDNPTTVSSGAQLTATLTGQPGSTSSITSTATGSFLGQLDQSSTVLSYTVTYSPNSTPTAVSLDPATTSTSIASGTSPYSSSILLAGAFPATTTNPGSGTAITLTSPLSGTVSLSQTQANYLTGGQYQLTIRSVAYPNGELTGSIQIR